MRTHIFLRFCSLACLLIAIGPSGVARAESDKPSDEQLAAKVGELLEKWNKRDSPGCAIGVVRDGKLIYSKGIGSANLEYEVPNTPQTVFEVASFSKAFTSLCIAMLMDQGKVDPDDDIRKFVPEMHAFDPPVRVRHLLTCHSGLFPQFHIMPLTGLDNVPVHSTYTKADLLAVVAGQRKLPFEPGAEFRYGSCDFFLLGLIVERVTGESLAEFARKNIFQPLGMTRTFFEEDPSAVVKNRAVAHFKEPDDTWHQWRNAAYIVGGGGLNTCVEDLYRWDQNFYDNQFPAGRYVDEFINAGAVLGNRYCLDADAYRKKVDPSRGAAGQHRGLKRIQFTGGFWGTSSGMAIFPEQKFSVICLTNTSEISPWNIAEQIADFYLSDQIEPKPETKPREFVELPEEQLKNKVGAYHTFDGRIWTLSVKDGKLWNTNYKGETYEVKPLGENRFLPTKYPTDTFIFERRSPDEPFVLRVAFGGGSILFERAEVVDPAKVNYGEYAGEFFSDELSTSYRFAKRDGSLWFRVNARGWLALDPTISDRFVVRKRYWHDTRVFQFNRDENDEIRSLTISFFRVKGIDFAKK